MTSAEKREFDIEYLYRTENAWQFRIGENTPDYHSKSFADAGRHSDISLQEAREYRNKYLEAHPELRRSRPLLRLRLQKNNRTGIIGVNYSESVLPSGFITHEWQMTCPRPGGGPPVTANFSAKRHGEARALMMAVQARREAVLAFESIAETEDDRNDIQTLVAEYDDIVAELSQGIEKGGESELLNIIHEARLDATSKRSQINVRLGQHRFRRMVLARWNGCCAATGADIFVDASHIKPWCDSSSFDRINPDNGIALSSLYHKAFDRGFIAFANDGTLLVAEDFRERLLRLGMNLNVRISGLTEDHSQFLEHHRSRVFRDNQHVSHAASPSELKSSPPSLSPAEAT